MKNSKEFSGKIKKAYRAWKRQADATAPAVYDDPIEALVYALLSEHRSEPAGRRYYKRVQRHFVDFNDLRVSRNEEIFDLIDDHGQTGQDTAERITKILNQIYDKYGSLSLRVLKETGKRQGRKELEELDSISRFVVDYCFVTALRGHAIPLTAPMIDYLQREELVDSEATEEEIHGFLDRQVSAADGWSFYSLLRIIVDDELDEKRRPSESAPKKAAVKKTKKKAKKKTKKKKKKSARKTNSKK